MSAGRKVVQFVEAGLIRGVRASKHVLRGAAEILDEIPKAAERIGAEIDSAVEEVDKVAVEEEHPDA